MQAKVGTFTAPASTTGNQAVTGVGFEPTALLLWTSYQTAAGYAEDYYVGFGITDGSLKHWHAGNGIDSAFDMNRTSESTNLVRIENAASTNVRIGAFVSFDAGGFTINWTTADAIAPIFHYLAIECSSAEQTAMALGHSPANQTPEISARPSAAIMFSSSADGDAGDRPVLGWVAVNDDGSPNGQGAIAVTNEDILPTDSYRTQATDRCLLCITGANNGIIQEWKWTGTGLGTVDVASTTAVPAHLLALFGISAKAGSLNQPTSTGTQAISGLGFTPKVVLLMSVGNTTASGAQVQARFSFGAGDGTTQGRIWAGGEDNVNPGQLARGHSTSVILSAVATVNATGASNAADAECTLDSLDADGFTLDWTVADATAREVLWLALGDDADIPVSSPSGDGAAFSYGFIG